MFPSATASSPTQGYRGLFSHCDERVKKNDACVTNLSPSRVYSDLTPTITALGVPHLTLRPSTLLRQIMTAFLAGAGGGGAGVGAMAARCGAGAG